MAECVLKINIFEHNNSIFKHLGRTTIGLKSAPSYAIVYGLPRRRQTEQ